MQMEMEMGMGMGTRAAWANKLPAAGGGGDPIRSDPLLGMQIAIKIAMFAWPVMSQSDACLHCHHHLVRIGSLARWLDGWISSLAACSADGRWLDGRWRLSRLHHKI